MVDGTIKISPGACVRPARGLCFALVLLVIAAVPAGAGVSVRSGGKTVAVPSFERGGVVWVPAAGVAQQAGFSQLYNLSSGRLILANERGRILFIRDNYFYAADTSVAILSFPPVQRDSLLYLPVPDLARILSVKYPGRVSWDANAAAITFNPLTHTVLSISTEAKQNGTVASVVLADSLPYEVTYFHPNLAINFSGGSIDPKAIRRKLRAGVIDSAFTVQYEGSAQVSFILNHAIETPHVDYDAAKRTLMVALRPKIEQKKPSAPPAQVPHDISGIRTVVIDPGHGGKDPGAIGPTGVMEKDVVLGIGLELKKMLEKAGLKVHMTRSKDVFIPLRDRTKFANDKRADIFVSIHADAIDGDKKKRDAVKGYKVYFLSHAKNEEDKMVAMRENAVIELEGKESIQNYTALQDVLNSIAGAEYLRESQDLSIIIEQSLGSNVKTIPRLQLGVGQANFFVLNGALMPSVLVEVGFISNTAEETLLSDKRTQYQQAAALNAAIIQFKKQVEGL